eukprot:CAMPEP_0171619678 /NCGR_PEP_ID=MMETSP0990-20121206/15521_1 /TAXON_ID=483369 /ORGANISM="non described non described, Strain CCMP2098" /LENGTH=208 /DNA_ID=CAMNT_0012184791 /DNA_START=103 /DNA_END=729 /DNA_ORIENTATION=-
MPTITDFSKVEFVPVYDMHLERPSIIVSGTTASGPFKQFKFYIDENTDIADVIFVLRNHIDCTKDEIEFCTAGFGEKKRGDDEKISDIYGAKQREGQAHRFMRREMMQVSIWPRGYTEREEARFAKMFDGPKIYGSPLEEFPDAKKEREVNAKKYASKKAAEAKTEKDLEEKKLKDAEVAKQAERGKAKAEETEEAEKPEEGSADEVA